MKLKISAVEAPRIYNLIITGKPTSEKPTSWPDFGIRRDVETQTIGVWEYESKEGGICLGNRVGVLAERCQVDNQGVSRRHLDVYVEEATRKTPSKVTLQDEQSSLGSFINKQRFNRLELQPGKTAITLGRLELVFDYRP